MAKSHQSKEFRLMRSVVLWIHDFKCLGNNCDSKASQVHHDDRVNTNNEIINLIPLCSRCHKMIHKTNFRFRLTHKRIIVQLLRKIVYFSKK